MSSAVTTTQLTYWMMCPTKSERTMVSLSTPILLSGIDNLCTLNHLTRGLFSQCQKVLFGLFLTVSLLSLPHRSSPTEGGQEDTNNRKREAYIHQSQKCFIKKKDEIGEPAERIAQMDFKLKENRSYCLQLTSCEGLCCTSLSSAVSVYVPTSAGLQLINCFMGRS